MFVPQTGEVGQLSYTPKGIMKVYLRAPEWLLGGKSRKCKWQFTPGFQGALLLTTESYNWLRGHPRSIFINLERRKSLTQMKNIRERRHMLIHSWRMQREVFSVPTTLQCSFSQPFSIYPSPYHFWMWIPCKQRFCLSYSLLNPRCLEPCLAPSEHSINNIFLN